MPSYTVLMIVLLNISLLTACSTGGSDDAEDADSNNSSSATGSTDSQSDSEGNSTPTDTSNNNSPANATECDDWQNQQPSWLWCDGFEASSSLSSRYQDVQSAAAGGFDVSTTDSFSGQQSLRQQYMPNQVDAGWISWFYGDALGGNHGPSHNEIFMRWYHKFEPGFEGMPPKMARLRRLEAGFNRSTAVHFWVDLDSGNQLPLVADIFAPNSPDTNGGNWLPITVSTFLYSDAGNIGRWVCHEMQVKNNSAGNNDGIVRFWADDQLILERTDFNLSGNSGENFNEVMLDTYWNGGSPKQQSRYYDNFVIATSRIGC